MPVSQLKLLTAWCCSLLLSARYVVGVLDHGLDRSIASEEGTCTPVEGRGSAMVQAKHLVSALSVSGQDAAGRKHALREDPGGKHELHEDPGESPVVKSKAPALSAAVPHVAVEAERAPATEGSLSAAEFFEQQVASLAPSFVQMGSDESHRAASKSASDTGAGDTAGLERVSGGDQTGARQPAASQAPSFVQMGSDDSRSTASESVVDETEEAPGSSSIMQHGELAKWWRHWLHGIVPYSLAFTWMLTVLVALFVVVKVAFIIRDHARCSKERPVKLWVPNMGEAADLLEGGASLVETVDNAEDSEAEDHGSDTDDQTVSDVVEDWEIHTPSQLSPRTLEPQQVQMIETLPVVSSTGGIPFEIQDALTRVACQ